MTSNIPVDITAEDVIENVLRHLNSEVQLLAEEGLFVLLDVKEFRQDFLPAMGPGFSLKPVLDKETGEEGIVWVDADRAIFDWFNHLLQKALD